MNVLYSIFCCFGGWGKNMNDDICICDKCWCFYKARIISFDFVWSDTEKNCFLCQSHVTLHYFKKSDLIKLFK